MSKSDLRGPSADALSALSEQLEGAGGDQEQLGEHLHGVADLLRSEPGLRRVVTDMSTDPSAKSALVRQIFEGKIADAALDLVADAAERRWTRAGDLAVALEHLAVLAFVASAGDDDSERLSDELFQVGRLINDQADLRTALSDPARSGADKGRLLGDLLGDKTLRATQRLAQLALTGTHRSVTVAIEEYQKVAADAHGQRVAEVRVAQELSEAEYERLGAALSNQYGRTVHLNVVVDPGIMGGMRVEIGDDVIDGTVSGRLDDARRKLAG